MSFFSYFFVIIKLWPFINLNFRASTHTHSRFPPEAIFSFHKIKIITDFASYNNIRAGKKRDINYTRVVRLNTITGGANNWVMRSLDFKKIKIIMKRKERKV